MTDSTPTTSENTDTVTDQVTPAETAPPVTQETPAPATPAKDGLPDNPAELKGIIHALRRENTASRLNAKAQAAEEGSTNAIQYMGRALGLIADNDEDTPDADTLIAQLTAERDAARTAQTHLAVYKAAATAGVNADALLDSVSFLNTIKEVDPSDADAVTAAVTTWAQAHPQATPTPAVGSNTIEHAAGSGENTISAEAFAAMSAVERSELYRRDPDQYRRLAG